MRCLYWWNHHFGCWNHLKNPQITFCLWLDRAGGASSSWLSTRTTLTSGCEWSCTPWPERPGVNVWLEGGQRRPGRWGYRRENMEKEDERCGKPMVSSEHDRWWVNSRTVSLREGIPCGSSRTFLGSIWGLILGAQVILRYYLKYLFRTCCMMGIST